MLRAQHSSSTTMVISTPQSSCRGGKGRSTRRYTAATAAENHHGRAAASSKSISFHFESFGGRNYILSLHWSSFPDVVEVQRSVHHQELVNVHADAEEHCGVSPAGNLLVGSY